MFGADNDQLMATSRNASEDENMAPRVPGGGNPNVQPFGERDLNMTPARQSKPWVRRDSPRRCLETPQVMDDGMGMDVDDEATAPALPGAQHGWTDVNAPAGGANYRGRRNHKQSAASTELEALDRSLRSLEKFSVDIPPADGKGANTPYSLSNVVRLLTNRIRGRHRRGDGGKIHNPDEVLVKVVNHILEQFTLSQLPCLMNVHGQIQQRLTNLFEEEYNKSSTIASLGGQPRGKDGRKTHRREPRYRPGSSTRPPASRWNFSKMGPRDLEPVTSPHYARESLGHLDQVLSKLDHKFALHLVQTCSILNFKLPDFSGLTRQDGKNREYDFEMNFTFGYSYADNCDLMNEAFNMRKRNFPNETRMPTDCCNEIAKMLGNTRFEILLKVYFDKTKSADWHEQDGEAWIYHPYKTTKEVQDLVNFDRNDRIYYVENWPETGLLSDDYSRHFSDGQNPKLIRNRIERTMVTWICSQITWLAFKQIRLCKSKKVRNRLSKLLFVLKGWYTGLLLGESFDPEDMGAIVEEASPHVVA